MHRLWIAKKRPIGFAFEIADLMRLEKWAKVHNVRMVVELDHYVEDEEYEEVIAFYAKDSPIRRWIPLAVRQRGRHATANRSHLSLRYGCRCSGQPADDPGAWPASSQDNTQAATLGKPLRNDVSSIISGDAWARTCRHRIDKRKTHNTPE